MPVIVLTACSDEIDRVVGLELGADDYVPKPFSPRESVARVQSIRCCAAKPTAAPVVVTTAPIPMRVDEGRRQICFCGRALEVSRYEHGLLEKLAARPGHVFSRAALIVCERDDATERLDRTVDAHVKTLRAKMKAIAPGLGPTRTHRGSGYALAENLPAEPGAPTTR